MNRTITLFLFILLIILLSGCGAKDTYELKTDYIDKPAHGDLLIDASIGEPATLNPVLASDSASSDIIGLVFNGLVKFDKDLNLTGDLAEKWEVSNKGKTIIFHLRRNVKWHDGEEFTSKDVKFTYEKFMDPSVKTAYRSLFEPIKTVKIIDKYTVRVDYKTAFAPALQYWGAEIIPWHILHDKDINTAEFNRKPVGTGPYIFDKWITAQKIELRSNPEYFKGEPYIKRYNYRIIPDQSVQFMELQAGSADMMTLTSDLYFTKADSKKFNEKFNKFRITTFSYVYMGLNLNNPFFIDKKVRKAISYAVNKKEIIEGVKRGLARRVTGPFIPGTWAYSEKAEKYNYDLEKAKSLLKEEGWNPGKDGILEKNGNKFKFTIMTNQGNKERETVATIIQQQLGKLGIKAEVRILAWNIFLTEFINKKKFDAVVMGWSTTPDPDCYDIWHSSKTKEGEFNFVSYSNPEVDKLSKAGRETFDKEKRKLIYNRIHELIADDAPYVFLYSGYGIPAVHKRFHGIKPKPAGISYNFIKWYVPKDLQKYTFN